MTTSPKDYWGYLIDPQTKGPTPRLEQLLLGIAHYVIKNVEPHDHHVLTPAKLSAFYRGVGGDLDELFLDTPPASLSFIYSALGCFHSLQPSQDAFKPPSIPALTTSGFVRWETIQLLLEPDEHAAFLQDAVRKYDIPNKGADGGSLGSFFPPTLPRECFPARPDESMCRWHEATLQELRRDVEAAQGMPRPKMRREYSGPSRDDESDSTDDEARAGLGSGIVNNVFVNKLRNKIQQRLGRDNRPASKDSRERRYKRGDDMNGVHDPPPVKRRSPESGRPASGRYYSTTSNEELPRHPRSRRTYTGSSYESPGSPGSPRSPRSPMSPGHMPSGHMAPGSGPLPPQQPPRHGPNWAYSQRDRGRTPPEEVPGQQIPAGSSRLQRPTHDQYARRHSSHMPYSTLDPEDELRRNRSRSHSHGRSPQRMSPGRFAPAGAPPPPRPSSGYFPPTSSAGSPGMAGMGGMGGGGGGGGSAQPPPPGSGFARGRLRHTINSPGSSPYRGRRRGEDSYDKDHGRRLEEGWRYVPADRAHIR